MNELKPGDRVSLKYFPDITGTVAEVLPDGIQVAFDPLGAELKVNKDLLCKI